MYFGSAQYKQKGNTLIFLLIGVLVLAVGSGAFYLGRQTTPNSSPTPAVTSPTLQPTSTPSSTPSSFDETGNWKTYTNSSEFTFKYPPDWKVAPDTYKFNYISVRSPDYSINTEGIETLEKGVEVMVYTATTTETSIDKKFEQDRFAGQIASSKTFTTVDGQKAIQYDYSYESTQATDTIFIKNGMHYLIKLQYADSSTKSRYLPTYLGILESFKGI